MCRVVEMLVLVEDDEDVGRATVSYLLRSGHAVDWLRSGNALLSHMKHGPFDCILLDLGLPDLDGKDCLANLRASGHDVPVIVLSARGEASDRVELLQMGADDYLVKPVDLEELMARLRRLMRRREQATSGASAGFRLESARSCAVVGGREVRLSATEFRLVACLLQCGGRPVGRHLLEAMLPGSSLGSEAAQSLDVHLHRLRRKLGAELIRFERGQGYRIVVGAEGGDVPADSSVRRAP